MLFLGAQKGYPPWAVSPPQIKGRPPQLVKPSQPRWFFLYACFRLQSIKQWIDSTTTSTLPDLSSSTSQKYFLQCASFKTPKLEKKTHPPNDRFLIKIQLKSAAFGSSERLPPLSGVPPTNKRTPPPISKTQPAAVNFLYACFRLQSSKQWVDSTTTSTLPDLSSSTSQIYFLQCGNFKTPKLEKKTHPPNDRFLIKM